MGNGQSTQAPRRGKNKLSKPKTKPSAVPSSTSNTPNASRRNSVIGKGAVTSSTAIPYGKHLSIPESAPLDTLSSSCPAPTPSKKKRMSIFRSRSSKKEKDILFSEALPDPIPTNTAPIVTGRFGSRTNSINSTAVEAPLDKPWASTPSSRPSCHRSRNSLPHVPYASSSDSNRLSLVSEALSPKPDSVHIATGLAGQHGDLDWQRSDPSYQRSQSDPAIYAPIRRKSLLQHGVATRPSVPLITRSTYRNQRATYSDFGGWTPPPLALRTNIDNQSPGARTSTPNDLSHIGAFKLGSLRITNGSASPTPSVEDRRASLPSTDQMAAVQAITQHHAMTQRSYTISVPTEAVKPRWSVEPQAFTNDFHTGSSSHDSLTIHIPSVKQSVSPSISPNNAHILSVNFPTSELSPFSFVASPITLPTLEATSKKTSVEDELFEAEMSTPTLEPSSGIDKRSFDSGYGPSPATPEQQVLSCPRGPREFDARSLAKTDSGYSSSTSRRNSGAPTVPPKEAPPLPSKEPLNRAENVRLTAPGNHPHNMNVHAIPMTSPNAQLVSRMNKGAYFPTTNQSSPLEASSKYHRQSMPVSPLLQDQRTPTNNSSRWRSLRQRPQSYQASSPLYTIQAFKSTSEQSGIPPIPVSTERHLGERVDSFPTKSFPNTEHMGLRRPSSKETLATIMSVGSAEVRDEATYARLHGALPPVPASIPEEDYLVGWRPPNMRRHTMTPSAPTTPKTERRSLHPFPTPKSLNTYPQEDQTDFETHLTSIDNISSSLGASPYDLALTAMGDTSSKPAPRTKSMTAQLEAPAARKAVSKATLEVSPMPRPELSSRQASYNSIANGNPFANGSTGPNSRTSSSGSTFTIRDLPSQRRTADEDAKRLSLARVDRVKSPPPISMQTQRKPVPRSTPSSSEYDKSENSSRNQSPTRLPEGKANRELVRYQLSEQEAFWHPSQQTDEQQLAAYPSAPYTEKMFPPRSQSARPAAQCHRPLPVHHYTFDLDKGQSRRSSYSEKEWEMHAGDYDHTYGSQLTVHAVPEIDASYFDEYQPCKVVEPADDVLVLDRYAGGLGYGYTSDYELSNAGQNAAIMAAGGKKGVDATEAYGLDFSDVPVFQQRVRVGV
ncbi:proteophosphoglycan ppg4 protein [Rutstroemia sp. NJR-2017a BBW]|nr:proteophosphoglycan ppg4 protein [Rutstroemia sp. NJR-2017a BBW]